VLCAATCLSSLSCGDGAAHCVPRYSAFYSLTFALAVSAPAVVPKHSSDTKAYRNPLQALIAYLFASFFAALIRAYIGAFDHLGDLSDFILFLTHLLSLCLTLLTEPLRSC